MPPSAAPAQLVDLRPVPVAEVDVGAADGDLADPPGGQGAAVRGENGGPVAGCRPAAHAVRLRVAERAVGHASADFGLSVNPAEHGRPR